MNYVEEHHVPGRALGLAVVLVLHAALVYGLIHGLARKVILLVQQPLQTELIEELRTVKEPPPVAPPPPQFATPPPPAYIPPPEVRIQAPPPAEPTIAAITHAAPATPVLPVAAPPAPVALPPPVRTAPVIDAAHSCDKPVYPPQSLRAQESGTVRLNFLIDTDGHVVDSKIERSSGHGRLDQAAREALTLCRFKPGTVNGRPERSWAKLEYEWRIE